MQKLGVCFFSFCAFLWGEFNLSTGLIDIPVADVLQQGVIKITLSGSHALIPSKYPQDTDITISTGLPYNLEIGIAVYTQKDVVGFAAMRLREMKKGRPAIAVGVHNITGTKIISSVGSGRDARGEYVGWEDDVEYRNHGMIPPEFFSWFFVASFRPSPYLGYHFGIGRGKYVGYGPLSGALNTDAIFTDAKHEWAFGLFGAQEVYPTGDTSFSLVAEADGRDINLGVIIRTGSFEIGAALTHAEQVLFHSGRLPYRFSFGLSYIVRFPTQEEIASATENPGKAIQGKTEENNLSLIQGFCYDKEAGYPLKAKVYVVSSGDIVYHTEVNGEFKIYLPADYGEVWVVCLKEGYSPQRMRFNLVPQKKYIAMFKMSKIKS